MNIETRLAKLEGINKSRSEKLIQAKAKAKQLFGIDDAASLKKLWEKVSHLETELGELVALAQEHLEVCVTKIENKVCLSEFEIQLSDDFTLKINALKSKINAAVNNATSEQVVEPETQKKPLNIDKAISFEDLEDDKYKAAVNDQSYSNQQQSKSSDVKFPKSAWEISQKPQPKAEISEASGMLEM
jgi:hypothetical protein